MLNSTVLDVAIGLVFSFLAISLGIGVMVEAISSIMKWRARTLLAGIKDLVNDQQFADLAKSLYGHASINPRGPGSSDPAKYRPAYIDPKLFASAFMDITGMSQAVLELATAGAATTPAAAVVKLRAAFDQKVSAATNKQIADLVHGMIDRALGDPEKLVAELGAWFDNGMDRLSGAYKRWTQALSFAIALLVAVALNVNTIALARALWEQPALTAKIQVDPKIPDAATALQTLETHLPAGWPNGHPFTKRDAAGNEIWFASGDLPEAVLGWILTAVATLFGAPFWFDALQSITRLKGTGPSPDEKKVRRAAAA